MKRTGIGQIFTAIGVAAAHPTAFLIVIAYAVAWLVFEHETFDWHGVATLASWIMTLFIQRAEHRDTQAIHAKLDELLGAQDGARNEVKDIDEREPEEIEGERERQ
jgi:low affinity Fe/Cu permease